MFCFRAPKPERAQQGFNLVLGAFTWCRPQAEQHAHLGIINPHPSAHHRAWAARGDDVGSLSPRDDRAIADEALTTWPPLTPMLPGDQGALAA
jgi:hypothetical protein